MHIYGNVKRKFYTLSLYLYVTLLELYMNCLNCNSDLNHGRKYCGFKCQNSHQTKSKVKLWLEGKHDGMRGKTSTAHWIKQYLINNRGEKCEKCGWGIRNPYTKKIPIELNHIDGDFTNNKIENLELICPNCHALTPSYKGANKKVGRPRSKYYRGL